jgi:type II secretory ATPase GspE/PulE/Tfp pilus assembly ATPase PilB-like protein
VGEEVGLHNLNVISPQIFDIDIHRIPASEKKNEPEHWHIDVRYILQASASEEVNLNLDECLSYKWQAIRELAALEDQSVARLALKTRRKLIPADLAEMGFEPSQIALIKETLEKDVGLFIVSGASYSGMEDTRQALINLHLGNIKTGGSKPVVDEKSQDESVDPHAAFKAVVRSSMRAQPEFVVHSELRDEESAKALFESASAGHTVFTTVCSSSAVGIVTRLRTMAFKALVEELGKPDFLSLLINQTKLPLVCQHCSIGFEQFKQLDDDTHGVIDRIHHHVQPEAIEALRFRNHDGCPSCIDGTTGLTVAAEVIAPDAFMRQSFRENKDLEALFHYRRQGGYLALEHGLMKAFRGEVDIRDVELRMDQIVAVQELDDASNAASGHPQQAISLLGKDIFEDKMKADLRSLDSFGYTPEQLETIRSAAKKPVGAVIIAGKTSGALSSTLTSLLDAMRNDPKKQAD